VTATAQWAPARLARARIGTTATFGLAGALSAIFMVRIPALTDKLHLDAGQVGVTVLCWGLGSLVSLQVARTVLARTGSRRALLVSAPATALLLVAAGLAPSYPLLLAAVSATGLAFGGLDVSMNAQAAVIEREYARHIMNGAHAGWSVGSVVGGGIGALTAAAGLGFTAAVTGTAVLCLPVAILLGFTYLPDPPVRLDGERRRVRVPRVVYLLGAVTLCSFLVEGSVANWTGLYLRDDLHAAEAIAAVGYPAFEFAMIIGRTVGDRVRRVVGARRMLLFGGLGSSAGVGIVILAPWWPLAIVGCVVIGLAICTVVPLTFSIAGTLEPSGAGIAQAGAMGYAGMLLGPPVIGYVADSTSLRVGLAVVAGVAVVMAMLGSRVPSPGQ
jgi:MFS family permease